MTELQRIASRARRNVNKLLTAATYRVAGTHVVKAGAGYNAGATTMTFTGVPAAYTTTAAGHTFQIGLTKHTITNAVANSSGTMTGVTFTPALASTVALNQNITVSAAASYGVNVIAKQVDGGLADASSYAPGDWRIMLFDLTVEPKPGHTVEWGGRTVTVQEGIGRDEASAHWVVRGKVA